VIKSVAQGHSGYLDIASQLGVPGLVTIISAMFLIPIAKLLLAPRAPRGLAAFLMATVLFIMAHNFTESSLMDRDTLMQVFLVIAGMLVHLIGREDAEHAVRRPARYPRHGQDGDDED
jgi:O-antigen ligase